MLHWDANRVSRQLALSLDCPRAAVPSLAVQLRTVFSVAGGEKRHSPRAQTLQKGPPAEGQDT